MKAIVEVQTVGVAYWYNGNADAAIAPFQKSLTCEPTKADTLFNLGIVELQGKHDAQNAVAAWQKLLDSNPEYQNKERARGGSEWMENAS